MGVVVLLYKGRHTRDFSIDKTSAWRLIAVDWSDMRTKTIHGQSVLAPGIGKSRQKLAAEWFPHRFRGVDQLGRMQDELAVEQDGRDSPGLLVQHPRKEQQVERRRLVSEKELLRIAKDIQRNPGPDVIRTTVTGNTFVAIRSSTGKLGSVTGSYTIRCTGDAQIEIFSGGRHISWPCEVRKGDKTRKIVDSVRAALVDYLDEMVKA